MTALPNPLEHRTADHPIEEIFLKRWSPRSMNGEPVDSSVVKQLFEAARWAPSSYNEQEWRFMYAHRDTDQWSLLFDVLMEANQAWCKNAGVLILAASRTTFAKNGKPNSVHELDTGMAVQNLLLQTASLGLVGHAMAGFDRGKSKVALELPDGVEPHCMIAIGHPGEIEVLPEDFRGGEEPSGRKSISEISVEGKYSFDS